MELRKHLVRVKEHDLRPILEQPKLRKHHAVAIGEEETIHMKA